MTRIQKVLDKLKSQLDENSTRLNPNGFLDEDDKDILREKCTFAEPANEKDINSLEKELGIIIPDDYREFLLIHNGMTLFESYLISYDFFSLDEIRKHFKSIKKFHKEEDLDPIDAYPIGEYPGAGYIMIDNKKVTKHSSQGTIYVNDIIPEETGESFLSFVENVMEQPGEFFWEDPNLPES